MQYDEKIAKKMLSDERWKDIVTIPVAAVWKTRGEIPDQYFNQTYLSLIAEGKNDLAKKVQDKYYNQEYIVRVPLTKEEARREKIILEIISSPKFMTKRLVERENIKIYHYQDSIREARRIPMYPQHILRIKNAVVNLRNVLKNLVETLQKIQNYGDINIREIDNFLKDDRIAVYPFYQRNKTYSQRHGNRVIGKSTFYDKDEIQYFIHCANIFLLETQTEL